MDISPVTPGEWLAGKYRVERTLGVGGMGVVVAARHEALDVPVAIKFLLPAALSNLEAVTRFAREARVAAGIRSEHVARVLDVGSLETGAPYMVMEYLEGVDLAQVLHSQGPLSVEQAVDYVLQAGEAIAEAHSLGVVHRDLKPANLFLTRRADGSECIKVLDFGISKIGEGHESTSNNLTKTSALMGSPLYMSPEQLVSSRDVDARGDIWALGVILYELVAGVPPFSGETLPAVLTKIMSLEPPPLRSVSPNSPPRLEQIVARCLEKQPERRYPSIAALAAELAHVAPPRAAISIERITSIGGQQDVLPRDPVATGQRSLPSFGVTTDPALRTETAGGGTISLGPLRKGFKHTVLNWLGLTTVPVTEQSTAGKGKDGPSPQPKHAATPSPTAPTEAGGGWHDLHRVLPPDSPQSSGAIKYFLAANFRSCKYLSPSVVELFGLSLLDVAQFEFFGVMLTDVQVKGGSSPARMLSTELFSSRANPLESHLARMGGQRRKIVLAILDSYEVASGVRQKILEYQTRFNAVVVTLHLAELVKALAEVDVAGALGAGPAQTLLKDRLADLHTVPDLYAASGPSKDPTSFYGMVQVKSEVIAALQKGQTLLSICGPPGSGKSSLLNMVELELGASRKFLSIRCSDAMEREPLAFAREVAALLSNEEPSSAQMQAQLRRTIVNSYNPSKISDVVLVLEDADWLMVALRDSTRSAEQLKNIQEFWMAILTLSRKPGVSVVVTGLFGFELKTHKILGWQNSLATYVRVFRLYPLDGGALRRMIRDLGIQMNVRFDEAALDVIHEETGGNIDIARKLCSRIVHRGRSRSEHHALRMLVVTEPAARRAVRDMAFIGESFDQTLIPWLSTLERQVLRVVATSRPKTPIALAQALGGRESLDAYREALERLRMLGLVDRKEDRETISIPILNDWAKYNLDSGRAVASKSLARKAAYVGLGLSFTTALFVAHHKWMELRMLTTPFVKGSVCTYSASYPERAASGSRFTIFVFRTCPEAEPAPAASTQTSVAARELVTVSCASGNTVTLEGKTNDRAIVMPCAGDDECTRASVHATLNNAGAGPFVFRLAVTHGQPVEFKIARDPFALVSDGVQRFMQGLATLPALAGAIVAFFGDVLKLLKRIRGG